MSDYFSVFTYQWWNYLLPATQSERQRYWMYVSVDIISSAVSKQVHTNMTDNRRFINAASSTFPLLPCLYCAIVDILLSSPTFSHPLPISVSYVISRHQTLALGANAFSIPTLFIVSSFKTTCFSCLHQFVAVGPFPPLFVLLIRIGILPFFCDSSPKSLTCFCTSIVVLGGTFCGLILQES